MSTFSIADIKSRAKLNYRTIGGDKSVLDDFVRNHAGKSQFDFYLSLSSVEPELIIGTTLSLEDCGYSVCLDSNQVHDSTDRRISQERVQALRTVMERCLGMIIMTTSARSDSIWLPWECGYFEGKKSRIAVLPITPANSEIYRGDGYLGLYPFITRYQTQNQKTQLVVKYGTKVYCTLSNWLAGGEGIIE